MLQKCRNLSSSLRIRNLDAFGHPLAVECLGENAVRYLKFGKTSLLWLYSCLICFQMLFLPPTFFKMLDAVSSMRHKADLSGLLRTSALGRLFLKASSVFS